MGSCKGMHCDGCGHGGGGAAGAVVALVLIVAVAAREVWPKVVHAVEIAAWTVAGATGTALVITGTVLTVRAVRRRRARKALAYRPGQPVVVVVVDEARALFTQFPPAGRPVPGAIEPPSEARPGRWPVSGSWSGGTELRPRIGGDDDARRR
jgi:hypothetical protein